MAGNTDKNKWIDDTLNSIKGMQRMPADPLMYDKVMQRLSEGVNNRKDRVRILLPRIAAAAVLLLVINAVSILHYTKKQQSASAQTNVYQVINEEINASSDNNF